MISRQGPGAGAYQSPGSAAAETTSNVYHIKDDTVLELAAAAQAKRIITFNLKDFRGTELFGVTAIKPHDWIGEWESLEPQQAIQEVVRRHLRAYGPATPDDFARWFGLTASQAKKVFRSLGDEIPAVEVEGWTAWALTATLESLPDLDAAPVVRLLPQFDAYVLGVSRDCEPILAAENKSRVYRPQGWISAVVLVNGRMEGIWTYDRQGNQVNVQIQMFAPAAAEVKRGIEAEAERLGNFLNMPAVLVYE